MTEVSGDCGEQTVRQGVCQGQTGSQVKGVDGRGNGG